MSEDEYNTLLSMLDIEVKVHAATRGERDRLRAECKMLKNERDMLREALVAMFNAYEGVYDMAVPKFYQSDEAIAAESLAREVLKNE